MLVILNAHLFFKLFFQVFFLYLDLAFNIYRLGDTG